MKGLFKRGEQWWVRCTPLPGHPQQRLLTGESDESRAILRALELLERDLAAASED